jgi:hypothetical protein
MIIFDLFEDNNETPQGVTEEVDQKGALKAAQDAAKFMLRNLDDRSALKDYSLHFWSPAKFYQGATMAMRGVGFDEIVKHITQDRPVQHEHYEQGVAETAPLSRDARRELVAPTDRDRIRRELWKYAGSLDQEGMSNRAHAMAHSCPTWGRLYRQYNDDVSQLLSTAPTEQLAQALREIQSKFQGVAEGIFDRFRKTQKKESYSRQEFYQWLDKVQEQLDDGEDIDEVIYNLELSLEKIYTDDVVKQFKGQIWDSLDLEIYEQGVAEAHSPEEFVKNLKKATKKKPKFQVGDWVTIDPNETAGWATSGMIGRIVDLYNDGRATINVNPGGGARGVQRKLTGIDADFKIKSGGTHTTVPVNMLELLPVSLDEQGVAEAKADPTGSWVVYGGSRVMKFKTHGGAKAYAEKNGGKVASSEFYADKIQKQGVAESAGAGEYYIWTVHFANPEKNPPRRVRVYSDEFVEELEGIKKFYAKKGLTVVDVDTDVGIRSEPKIKPERYEVDESSQSFHNGMQVKLTPEYADRPDEVFTVAHCDRERGRCWIGDEQGRGWYASFDQLIPVDDDEDMFENTPKMSARERLQRAVDREKKQAQLDRTGLSGMDYDQVQRQLRGIQDRTSPKKVDEDSDNEAVGQAIARRIMVGRTDLLLKYGPRRVMQAVDDVADYVGSVDEIGSSDVSGWVGQVERELGGVSEAANPAQQAAIAINMKKNHTKPKKK